jgi:hypothetical protein
VPQVVRLLRQRGINHLFDERHASSLGPRSAVNRTRNRATRTILAGLKAPLLTSGTRIRPLCRGPGVDHDAACCSARSASSRQRSQVPRSGLKNIGWPQVPHGGCEGCSRSVSGSLFVSSTDVLL